MNRIDSGGKVTSGLHRSVLDRADEVKIWETKEADVNGAQGPNETCGNW
jgi:hypothetical protein